MGQAVGQGGRGIPTGDVRIGVIHWLKKEGVEREMGEALRLGVGLNLGKDELQLLATLKHEPRVSLRADTHVVDAVRRQLRSVGLDGDRETASMKGVDRVRVELKQGLAARADNEGLSANRSAAAYRGPSGKNGISQFRGRRKLPSVGPRSDKIRIAELADGLVAVLLPPRPQVAAAETAEDCGTTGILPFTL